MQYTENVKVICSVIFSATQRHSIFLKTPVFVFFSFGSIFTGEINYMKTAKKGV